MYLLFKRLFERLPSDINQIFLVGKLTGRVIGSLGIHRKGMGMRHVGVFWHNNTSRVLAKGVGTELLKAGIDYARKGRFLRLEADTLARNKAMIRIVQKVGFRLEGIRRMKIKTKDCYKDEALLAIILGETEHSL